MIDDVVFGALMFGLFISILFIGFYFIFLRGESSARKLSEDVKAFERELERLKRCGKIRREDTDGFGSFLVTNNEVTLDKLKYRNLTIGEYLEDHLTIITQETFEQMQRMLNNVKKDLNEKKGDRERKIRKVIRHKRDNRGYDTSNKCPVTDYHLFFND